MVCLFSSITQACPNGRSVWVTVLCDVTAAGKVSDYHFLKLHLWTITVIVLWLREILIAELSGKNSSTTASFGKKPTYARGLGFPCFLWALPLFASYFCTVCTPHVWKKSVRFCLMWMPGESLVVPVLHRGPTNNGNVEMSLRSNEGLEQPSGHLEHTIAKLWRESVRETNIRVMQFSFVLGSLGSADEMSWWNLWWLQVRNGFILQE